MKTNNFKPTVIVQCYEDRQKTLPLRKTENLPSSFATNNNTEPKQEATDSPPPPPPMPTVNGQQNGEQKKLDNQKLFNTDNIKKMNLKNATLTRTPTPDYNKDNNNKINSSQLNQKNNSKDEKAELESLESYKLKNPANVTPKPPSNYFMRAPNGTATMKKHGRPVSVTIGEYASGGSSRREPSKLEFLNGDKPDGPHVSENEPITNRLQSELALTLSRSNLRKKTESLADTCR